MIIKLQKTLQRIPQASKNTLLVRPSKIVKGFYLKLFRYAVGKVI